MINYLLIALILWAELSTIVLFGLMAWDKWQAVHHRQRVPERVLLWIGGLGGGVGGFIAMKFLRHKTRKPIFYLVFLIGTAISLGCLLLLLHYYQ